MKKLSILAAGFILSLSSVAFGQQSEEELCKLYAGSWKMGDFIGGYVGGAALKEEEINSMISEENKKQDIVGKLDDSGKCTFVLTTDPDDEAEVTEIKVDGKEYVTVSEGEDPETTTTFVSKWVENQSINEVPDFQSNGKQIDLLSKEEATFEEGRRVLLTRLLLTSVDQETLRMEFLWSVDSHDEEGNPVKIRLWLKTDAKRL